MRARRGDRPPAPTTAVLAACLATLAALISLAWVVGAGGFAHAQETGEVTGDFRCNALDVNTRGCWVNRTASGREHEERAYWTQVAGAPYPEHEAPEGSPTPFEADLFAVRARNARDVLAGGAVCKDEVSPQEVEECRRVPVIYASDEVHGWREAYRSEEHGYVGAIAWLGKGRALAVGGTGTYPRREPNPPGGEWTYEARLQHDLEHGAGDARAWYLNEGEWEEITDSLPAKMNGFSALDIWIGRERGGGEWGLAGDYGHIWEWKGGRFTGKHIDRDSPSIGAPDSEWAVVEGPVSRRNACCGDSSSADRYTADGSSSAGFFHYRVREIRIAPDRTQKRAFAFTAGCCGPSAAGGSRRIEYVPNPGKPETGVPPDEAPPPAARPRWIVSSTDTYGDSVYSFALRPNRYIVFALWGGNDPFGEPQPEHGSIHWELGETVRAPGGPEAGSEPAPRYVASDGDTEPTPRSGSSREQVTGNGVPDWLAGQAPPSEPELRGLGVLATTVEALKPEYGGVRPHCGNPPGNFLGPPEVASVTWEKGVTEDPSLRVCRLEQLQAGDTPQLDPDGPLRTRESGIQAGPSWALNAIDLLDAEGVGFAVGDRGAILRLGVAPAESDPPSLGARRPAALAERSPYEERRPEPAAELGEVPALATQPRERLAGPRMVRAGSPDGNEVGRTLPAEDAHTIVMSRDGTEGWAIGPSPEARGGTGNGGVMTLYQYQPGQWTRCDPVGIPGIAEPDPACAELAELYEFKESGFFSTRIRLDAAARVPMEHDSDPSNDDEFEVLAVGSVLEQVDAQTGFGKRWIPTVIRFREGRWRLEDFESRRSLNGNLAFEVMATSLACTGPEECWLVHTATSGSGQRYLRRFDGERWIHCSRSGVEDVSTPLANREACGDLDNRLPRLSFKANGGLNVTSAGGRVYLGGVRLLASRGGSSVDGGEGAPVVLYKDYGPGERWRAEGGGYDPGFDDPSASQGRVAALAVARRADGRYEGWAAGHFRNLPPLRVVHENNLEHNLVTPVTGAAENALSGLAVLPLMRLDPEAGAWNPWRTRDAAYDYLISGTSSRTELVSGSRLLALAGGASGPGRAFMGLPQQASSQAFAFNATRERWELLEKPGGARYALPGQARPLAFAADGRDGAWAAYSSEPLNQLRLGAGHGKTYFYNYTQTPPREVFAEVASPLAGRERLTDLAGAPDGSVWLATDSGTLYRHDRLTGWERVSEIPGWDAGRVLTRRSPVSALALGPDGSGLAVGPRGRVAEIGPERVRLDAAAGTVCEPGAPAPPCGTSFDLRSAAIAPDGSALAGGENLALLWRPAGGELSKVPAPDASPFATITGIALPAGDRAWLALDTGQVFAGAHDGSGAWRWRLENVVDVEGVDRLVSEDHRGEPLALRDVAVDAAGYGFAVGDRGVVLERTGDPGEPWRRLDSGVTERLTSVALPAGQGPGALAGGERGLVLTHTAGAWHLARPGDRLRPDNGNVAGVALLPGYEPGQVEAWAGVASAPPSFFDNREGTSQLLHYSNAPAEPLLDPARGTAPLPDAPEPRAGEISFAAFGRSECQSSAWSYELFSNLMPAQCPPLENGTEPEQTILRRVRDEVLERSREPGGPEFAIFTGDAYETGGHTADEPLEQTNRSAAQVVDDEVPGGTLVPQWTAGERYRRFNEQLTDWLPDRGLPVFAPIGARDLSETRGCAADAYATGTVVCAENRDRARLGENIAWRQAMRSQPAPWGRGDPAERGELSFEPVRDSDGALRAEDVEVEVGDGGEPLRAPVGGASTHYAVDVVRGDEPLARLVVADTSAGSLAASDPIQQPLETDGGQATWLERVLCVRRAGRSRECTREPGQQAIVVSNTPTYAYVPASPDELQADAAVFESILLRNEASVVVSGRLGWNGRYWATAPGLHEPCPGEGYVPDSQAPEAGTRVCGQGAAELSADAGRAEAEAQKAAFDAVGDLGGSGVLPFVVASSAGGPFNRFAEQAGGTSPRDGFWRGYTIVRLHPSGDPRRTIVEQRPIFDWVSISGAERVLGANERLALHGLGRGPIAAVAFDRETGGPSFDEISTPAITHRFDLVLADPARPWGPCEAGDASCVALHSRLGEGSRSFDSASSEAARSAQDDKSARGSGLASQHGGAAGSAAAAMQDLTPSEKCDPYLCLPERIGTIDRITGEVKAGNGKYPDTFAVAMLSVGEEVATYPVMFKKSPSFVVQPFALAPPIPAPPSAAANAPQPPSPPNPPQPNVPQPNVPDIPTPPPVPPIAAAQPPEPQPPSPPAPPPPSEAPAPLSLTLAPPSIAIATPTAVIQPPTPPVNPAPPGGARREARQRQAATQKSGADPTDESSRASDQTMASGGDLAQGRLSPQGSEMTRHDPARAQRHNATARSRTKPEPSFTPVAASDQPSAWAKGLLYSGGLTAAALSLALGFTGTRPTPRRRTPEVPAPALARARRRGH